jgi:hypothetical protein
MGLEQIHKVELKVKAICTNQERIWLVQSETRMMHG